MLKHPKKQAPILPHSSGEPGRVSPFTQNPQSWREGGQAGMLNLHALEPRSVWKTFLQRGTEAEAASWGKKTQKPKRPKVRDTTAGMRWQLSTNNSLQEHKYAKSTTELVWVWCLPASEEFRDPNFHKHSFHICTQQEIINLHPVPAFLPLPLTNTRKTRLPRHTQSGRSVGRAAQKNFKHVKA